jgi:hypothetical protein
VNIGRIIGDRWCPLNSALWTIRLLKLGSGHRDPVEAPCEIVVLTERGKKNIRLFEVLVRRTRNSTWNEV